MGVTTSELARVAAAWRAAVAHEERMHTEAEARDRAAEEATQAFRDALVARRAAYTALVEAVKEFVG